MNKEMLAPAAALAVWTLVMLVWLTVASGAAFKKAGLDLSTMPPGSRGQDFAGRVPDRSKWPAHNYMHLVEQPTIFYPVVVILALVGATSLDLVLAWAYVGLRIAHSIWQATINKLPQRFALFALSSLCLAVLAVRALIATLT